MALAGLTGCGADGEAAEPSEPSESPGERLKLGGRPLPDDLPPGRIVQSVLWISDDPLDELEAGRRWAELLAQHTKTGLYPLLLGGMNDRGKLRPWQSGELQPAATPPAGDLDQLFREQWQRWDHDEVYGWSTLGKELGPKPFPAWPGLAAASKRGADPEQQAASQVRTADGMSQLLAGSDHGPYLGLVAAPDGATALTTSGWYVDAWQEPSIVVRSWQERFGVRVCVLGFDTLSVTAARPPASIQEARRLMVEHYLFCPDNFWQAEEPVTFESYAEWLMTSPVWTFWWD